MRHTFGTYEPGQKVSGTPRRKSTGRGTWVRFGTLVVITLIALFPIASVIYLSLTNTASGIGLTLSNFRYIFSQTDVLTWLRNSLIVSIATTFFAVAIGASAGYVVSRSRSKVVHWYSLGLFLLQSLPIVVFVIPLYIIFTRLALGNTLRGVVIIYVGGAIAVGTWIMAAYFDTIPKELEEAAWIDGCSVLGSYLRIVLVNSVPGLISTAIFSFLVAWNDYLVALIFLRSSGTYTLALGMQSFYNQFGQEWGPIMAEAVVMLLPPVIVFSLLSRYFNLGGIGGSLAGT
jgi:multiple sugar transport system permease protein